MVRFRFKRGLRFLQGTRRWSLDKTNAVGMLVFESQDEACERVSMTLQEVHAAWLSGTWVIDIESLGPGSDLVWHTTPADLGSLEPHKRLIAESRAKVLIAIKAHFESQGTKVKCDPRTLTQIVEGKATELGLTTVPHWSTIWKWWHRFAPTGCITRLADAPHKGRRINASQHALFQEVVDEVYLQDQQLTGKAVVEEIDRRYDTLNRGRPEEQKQHPPSPATVYRWLGKLHYSVVSAARNGKDFNRRERRQVTGSAEVSKILERYELDHTPVDVLIVCETTWLVLGRPWLTLVIDRHSRMIAGFYIGFHAPSATSVMYALRQAILPKEVLLAAVPGVKKSWPVRGCPLQLAIDNGMDLHADAVEQFCLELLIEPRFMGAAQPELKGAVERMFGTLSRDLFHTLPGTVFGSVDGRGDYPAEKRAALTLQTLTEILVRWIVDVYHCTPHRGLKGLLPLAVWQSQESSTVFDLPAYPRQMDLMVGHASTRSIFHYGVEYDSVRYSSTQLLAMRDAKSDTLVVAIKAYDDDVAYIDVRDTATGEYLRVPAVDLEYASGLNRHVHSLIRTEVRKRFGDKDTRAHLLLVKAEIQGLVKAAIQHKKAGTRKRAAALRLVDSEVALGTRPADALAATRTPKAPDDEPEIGLYGDSGELPRFRVLSDGAAP